MKCTKTQGSHAKPRAHFVDDSIININGEKGVVPKYVYTFV